MNVERASAAQRRRGRRLRAALRHERQSIATALAEFTHHACGASCGRTPLLPSPSLPPPAQPDLLLLYEEEPGGVRPASLAEQRGPHERIQRHTAEQIVESFVPVPMLDVPVPQTGPVGGRPQDLRRLVSCRASSSSFGRTRT